MENIMQNQIFIQDYAKAISAILDVDVTIIDETMTRIAGTGIYSKDLGKKISHDSFFRKIMNTKKFGIIKNVRKEFHCSKYNKFISCKELANLGYPIFLKDKVIGVIGIIAFTEDQREQLLSKTKKLEEFLKYMSLLLESKLLMLLSNYDLEQQIKNVINTEKEIIKNSKFIGQTKEIKNILKLADKLSLSNSTIIIRGESGTGKDVLAKYIHSKSNRRDKLMISINCAAIPESLVESELFGYEEGSFTGAKKYGHKGKFELAQGSTLFLDEIGDMPLATQAKLLRVLQEYKIERIGGKESIPIDVRIICATNKNLEKMVHEGKFREDLYYRLNVIPFIIPPLKERKEDIPLFINYFINYYNTKLKKNIEGITKEAENIFLNYDWPGNVREIKNIIEYLGNVVDEGYIDISHIPLHFYNKKTTNNLNNKTLNEIMKDYEKLVLTKLTKNISNLSEKDALAKKLGISRATLYRKLSNYNLEEKYK